MAQYDEFSDAYNEFFGSDAGLDEAYHMYANIEFDYVNLSDRAEKERAEDFIASLDYAATGGETYNALQDFFDMYGGSYDDFDWDEFREWYDAL